MTTPPFPDRAAAGRMLARELLGIRKLAGLGPDTVVIALPRGGVPVAAEVARALGAPLDILLVRKLGVPGHEEFAIGAIASGGVCCIDEEVRVRMWVSDSQVKAIVEREAAELARREAAYGVARQDPGSLIGRTVLLVDDGLATGSTMRAAIRALRGTSGAARIVAAVPVAPPETCARIREEADECVCLVTPSGFQAVGSWYSDFSPVEDEEVIRILGSKLSGGRRTAYSPTLRTRPGPEPGPS